VTDKEDDVADYRNVDPRIGTLEDFDEMLSALRAVNIKVIVDIVPNHSSDDHEWFQAALKAGKGSKERSRYIFRDG
jgi:alpha-glucosidase